MNSSLKRKYMVRHTFLCVIVLSIIGIGLFCCCKRTSVCDNKDGNKEILIRGTKFKMIHVEAGSFMMGKDEQKSDDQTFYRYNLSYPVHKVTLTKDYYISETEVTNELWQQVMQGKTFPDSVLQQPVECNWFWCQRFICELNKLTSLHFRLPTEAEWEFAARGGNYTQNCIYSGSDNLFEVGWFCDYHAKNNKTLGDSLADECIAKMKSKVHNVKNKHPNELLLYDMSGNVSEWVADMLAEYTTDSQINPFVNIGQRRFARGGSVHSFAKECEVSCRDTGDDESGIRLVLDY